MIPLAVFRLLFPSLSFSLSLSRKSLFTSSSLRCFFFRFIAFIQFVFLTRFSRYSQNRLSLSLFIFSCCSFSSRPRRLSLSFSSNTRVLSPSSSHSNVLPSPAHSLRELSSRSMRRYSSSLSLSEAGRKATIESSRGEKRAFSNKGVVEGSPRFSISLFVAPTDPLSLSFYPSLLVPHPPPP